MTVAEKWFRVRYKLSSMDKLTKEQWKQVNDLHYAIKYHNKPKLPYGTILVERKHLVEHLNGIKSALKAIDFVMTSKENKDFANSKGGNQMAKIWNTLNMSFQSIAHFQLNIPLERLDPTEMEDIK